MRLRNIWKVATFVLLWVTPVVALAQSEECAVIIEQTLAAVDELCADTGRNQACYGNVKLQAEPRTEAVDFAFSQAGDIANVADINSMRLSSLNQLTGDWGVALMRVQANLPETLPGQNVTFLMFGNVEVVNAGGTVVPTVTVSGGGINIRIAPTTSALVLDSLTNGETITADGRLADSSWVRVRLADGSPAWMNAGVITVDGDIASLDVVDPALDAGGSLGPMQAIYFTSSGGVGEQRCAEAPADGLLIQSPEGGGPIQLRINDADVQLGSTIFFQIARAASGGTAQMIMSVLEGRLQVRAFEITQIAIAGTRISIPLDAEGRVSGPPGPVEPFDPDVMANLPISALERAIEIPEPSEAPGNGDVAITLFWDNNADLDLIVTEPSGELVYFGAPLSSTRGELDIDSNYPCGENTRRVENVFWPTGASPEGEYQVQISQYDTCGAGNGNWTLIVRIDGRVVLQESGTADSNIFSFTR